MWGMVRWSVVWCGTVRYGTAFGQVSGEVWLGSVRFGSVRCGGVWRGKVWFGPVWSGLELPPGRNLIW